MVEALAVLIVIILSAMGIVEFYRCIVFAFFTPDKGKKFIVLVPSKGDDKALEYTLRCASSRAHWFRGNGRVICVDYGMGDENRRMCKQMEDVERMTPEELCKCMAIELQLEEKSDII